MANKYIKVTLAGETKSHIISATLRDFYLSQGAKIEIPTEDEILAVWGPAEEAKPKASSKEVDELRAAYDEATNLYNKEANKVAEQKKTIKELQDKVRVLQTSLDEAENVIANLQKQIKQENK